MKPVFISNNKMFYTSMLIICLGIIIAGVNYNKDQGANLKSTNKKMENVISVDKKVDFKGKKANSNLKTINKKTSTKKTSTVKKKGKINNVKPTLSKAIEESFFDNYKIERDRTRDREIELLREIINNPQSDKATRQDAQSKLFSITQNLERELDIENIIKANGFSNSVAFIHKSGVTVVMQNLNANKSQIDKQKDKVSEIVSLVTGFKKENIEILYKK